MVAVENPLDPAPLARIRFLAAAKVTAVMAPADDICRAIPRHYSRSPSDAWNSSVEFIAVDLHGPVGSGKSTTLHALLQPAAVRSEWESGYGPLSLWHAPGCEACRNSGCEGRVGIHDLLENSPRIAPLLYQRAAMRDIKAQSAKDGLRTLKQDGIEKFLQGLADLAEVRATFN